MDETQPTLLSRVTFVIMGLLIAAFCFSAVSVVAASADAITNSLIVVS